jgi:transposase-like protein
MSKQRRKYPEEFNKEYIEYFKSSDNVITEVVSEMGIRNT